VSIKIAVVSDTIYFEDYKNALVREIENKGFEAIALTSVDYDKKPDAFIMIGIHLHKKLLRSNEFIYCGIQTEQFPTRWTGGRTLGAKYLRHFKKYYKNYDMIFEWSKEQYEEMRFKYNNLLYFPYSSFDEITYTERNTANSNEQYDVIFIGDAYSIDNRRREMLSRLRKKFKVYPEYVALWGDDKANAICGSKICLNLHFDHGAYCEYPRLFEYFSNKKFVLSEKMKNSYPFHDGVDYISFYPEELEEVVEYYLKNQQETADIANNAYKTARKYRLSSVIDKVLLPILIEKNNRKSIDYRLLNSVFHASGIDSLKDIKNSIYIRNNLSNNILNKVKRLIGFS
jgi:hypothetical protein